VSGVARQRRERGDGAIYHDDERGRWVGQLDLGLSPTGRRRRPKVFGTTRQEVKDKLAALREADRQGVDLTARSVTFDQLAVMWVERDLDARVSDSTRANYRTLLHGQIAAAIGHRRVADLRTDDIEKMLLHLQELGRSGRYLRLALNLTRRVLDYAMRRDVVLRNVADRVKAPAGPTAERFGLTVRQARRLLEVAGGHRLGDLVTVSLLLGLRPGEAAGLTWDNVITESSRPTVTVAASLRRTPLGTMVLAPPKTRTSRRTLEIPPPVVGALKAQRRLQTAERVALGSRWHNDLGLVFTSENGTPLDPSNVRRTLAAMATEAGLGHVHPHMLRHAAASILSAAGVPIEEISDTLGHRSVTVTAEIYRHPIAPVRSGHVAAMTRLAQPTRTAR